MLNTKVWSRMCQSYKPLPKVDVIVQMGDVIDYFKPAPNKHLCDMLTSNRAHQWSSDGTKWLTPLYSSNTAFLGGSAMNYPRDHIELDRRSYLSSWGGTAQPGACCSRYINDFGVTWGIEFKMYFRSGALLCVSAVHTASD